MAKLDLRVREVLANLSPARERVTPPPAELRATRNGLLEWLYSQGIVEASPYSGHLADKLFFARLLELSAPAAMLTFHPFTKGVGELAPNLEANALALFPTGFVAKPVAGMNSEGGRIYLSGEEFLRDFAQDPSPFVGSGEEASPLTGLVLSGERYLLQAKVEGGTEFRLHTLEGRVVEGATFTRWDDAWNRASFARAEAALQKFLSLLPDALVRGQAWSVDLLETPAGFRVVEVNTNRGRPAQWSGDLSLPDTLQAYVLHLERYYGAKFLGAAGDLFRAGRANEDKFVAKFGLDAWERHQRLRAAVK